MGFRLTFAQTSGENIHRALGGLFLNSFYRFKDRPVTEALKSEAKKFFEKHPLVF